MQTRLTFIALLLVAACGGRIETVQRSEPSPDAPAPSPGTADSADTEGSFDSAPSAPPDPPQPSEPPLPPLNPSCASFAQVLSDLDQLGCSASSCHGGGLNLPLIDPARPLETKRGFYAFLLSNGMRYVDFRSLDPSTSAIACNLRGTCGVPMPLGGAAPVATIDLIERWLACGAPP